MCGAPRGVKAAFRPVNARPALTVTAAAEAKSAALSYHSDLNQREDRLKKIL